MPTITSPARSTARNATCTAGPSGQHHRDAVAVGQAQRDERRASGWRASSYSRHVMRSLGRDVGQPVGVDGRVVGDRGRQREGRCWHRPDARGRSGGLACARFGCGRCREGREVVAVDQAETVDLDRIAEQQDTGPGGQAERDDPSRRRRTPRRGCASRRVRSSPLIADRTNAPGDEVHVADVGNHGRRRIADAAGVEVHVVVSARVDGGRSADTSSNTALIVFGDCSWHPDRDCRCRRAELELTRGLRRRAPPQVRRE